MDEEQPAQSQEQPNQDSNLRTPQADQPVPREGDREPDAVPTPAPDAEPPSQEEHVVTERETVRQETQTESNE